ncbi:MAG: ABC transporter substrate-binding protein, partial [Deltaproteobacteria bacterium]|nr:ABC transporter substrate-binding protein [Deltaproteobacteria bacterium]
ADFAIRVGLARLGLHPDRDVTLRNIGGTNLRLAALQRGLVHFLVVTQGERVAAERMGFRLISDLAALKIPFPMTGYTATERYVRSRPEVIRGFTRAITEAIHYFKQHREASIAILARRSHLKDRAALEETYRWYQQHLPEAPYPPVEGFRVILQELARTRPELAGVDPQKFADTSFVKGLEDSGFIRALSRRP